MTAMLVYGTRGAPDLIVGTVGCGLVAVQAERGCLVLALRGHQGLHEQLPFLVSVTFRKWIRAVGALLRKAGNDVAACSVRSVLCGARSEACNACRC